MGSKPILTIILFFSFFYSEAQLPVCSSNHIVYTLTDDGIYNIDLSQANPVPVLNTILPPQGAFGLAVSPNLNGASPALTFYTIVNGMYHYYNGSSWVNTNHSAGQGVNIGGGGGYIYNYDFSGDITRYDGTGDAILVTTIPGLGSVADLAVDCSGNFFHLHNASPQTLTKYGPSGVILKVYTVSGAPLFSGGGGLVVFGNDVYYDDLSSSVTFPPLLHGTINGDTVNFVPAGISIKTAQDMASCPGSIVNAVPTNVSICGNQLPFTWNGQNYNAPGTYTATFSNASGCDSIATLNLVVNNLTFSKGNDTTICEGGSAQLVATSNAAAFTWTPTAALNNPSIANPVASPTITTQYTVTATLGGCSVSGTIKVTVNPAPIPNAGPDADICFGQDAQLSASGGTSYQWTPSIYLSSAESPNPTVTQPKQTTQYILHVKDANGCTSLVTDDVFVKITPPVEVTVSPRDSVVAEGDQIQLNATSIGDSYNWTNSSTLSNPNIPNPVAAIPKGSAGNIYTYIVTASTSAGCSDTASVTLKVYKGSDIYLPNGFTPNGDGKNDTFHPLTVGIKEINYFRVFNRWGQMVFSSSAFNEGWDGRLGGVDQPGGAYVWMVEGVTANNRVITKKGTVVLIR